MYLYAGIAAGCQQRFRAPMRGAGDDLRAEHARGCARDLRGRVRL